MENFKERMLTMKDLVDLAKTTRPTVYRWLKFSAFPKPVRIGRKLLWNKSEIEEYLEKSRNNRTESEE